MTCTVRVIFQSGDSITLKMKNMDRFARKDGMIEIETVDGEFYLFSEANVLMVRIRSLA
jgi:hypothetical protein